MRVKNTVTGEERRLGRVKVDVQEVKGQPIRCN